MGLQNRDWVNWQDVMAVEEGSATPVVHPRPGHADLAGALKYQHRDLRNVLERASARETAARVMAGSVAAGFLRTQGIYLISFTRALGEITLGPTTEFESETPETTWHAWREQEGHTDFRCPDSEAEAKMRRSVDRAGAAGDTLGGVVEVQALGVPPGLGSYVHWDRKLDAQLAFAAMSVPGIKAVAIGDGIAAAQKLGSDVHDPIVPGDGSRRWQRTSNRAGGLEGGVTNGEPVVLRAHMKPIATMKRPLDSVDFWDWQAAQAHHERSDVCAVPAAGVVVEAMVAFTLARAFLAKFGGDALTEIEANYARYREGWT